MDKNIGESTISSSEKVRKEIEEVEDRDEDEDEDEGLGEEEEESEEDESEEEEEEHRLDDIRLSKNPLVKDPWTYEEDKELKKLVESNMISVS